MTMYTFEELQVQKSKTSARRNGRTAKVRTQYMRVEGVEVIQKRRANRKVRHSTKGYLRSLR